jgi:hypothetical protein
MRWSVRALGVLVLTSLSVAVTPAATQGAVPKSRPAGQLVRVVRFPGQVTALAGPTASPTEFTLQVRDRSVDIRIMPRTVFQARTAEAQVDGFAQYDFAVATTTRVNGEWRAARVLYDVVPFGPIRDFTVTARVVSVDARGRNVMLRLLSGDTHGVRITVNTKYQVDGVPAVTPPVLTKDLVVVVTVHRNDAGVWVATLINLKA